MHTERRKHPRLLISVEVDLHSGHNFFSARTRDISAGGLFIETDVPLAIGAALTVEIVFSGERHSIEAEVTWVLDSGSSRAGVGVVFKEMAPSAQLAIARFMRMRAPIGFEADWNDSSPKRPKKGPPPLPERTSARGLADSVPCAGGGSGTIGRAAARARARV